MHSHTSRAPTTAISSAQPTFALRRAPETVDHLVTRSSGLPPLTMYTLVASAPTSRLSVVVAKPRVGTARTVFTRGSGTILPVVVSQSGSSAESPSGNGLVRRRCPLPSPFITHTSVGLNSVSDSGVRVRKNAMRPSGDQVGLPLDSPNRDVVSGVVFPAL